MRACAWAARCAYAASLLLLVRSYTIDCNRDYTDCDNEFRALNNDNRRAEESVQVTTSIPFLELSKLPDTTETTHFLPTIPTPKSEDANEGTVKPKGRLLDINEYPFISKHNHTEILEKSAKMDLSDINLDDDEDDFDEKSIFKMPPSNSGSMSLMPDKLLTQLQAPFHPSSHDVSAEVDICKENGVNYRIGETIPRGCEEICECSSLGTFECSPRCKHPYIRKGRKLNDPLCFETPVDECCSIMACATGNHGDLKSASTNNVPNSNVCRYGNNTYNVGAKWDVRCEQRCSCEKNSVVMCEPRCKQLPPSDICINVQDPKDSCCEIQVCDVSQDIHEEPIENATSTTAIPTEKVKEVTESTKSPTHPLATEPIGSIKVLQNNTVQINLLQMNTTSSPVHLLLSSDAGKTYKDVELKYSNLLLNLEGGKDYVLKTKETGTKFNFTITNTDSGINEVPDDVMKALNGSDLNKRRGCHQDGKFYEIGEEFHIGCSELCECTDDETKECVILECPVHVGLEILYKGCVRWAPTPPPQPPNCCPRAARCLSDGTCHYKDTAIPNWTEVPIWLTGCEQRCFCENGELDCQEICTPLTELPPQNLRCPPGQRPAPVNVSDDDCCKEWSCVKNAREKVSSNSATESMPSLNHNFVTPTLAKTPQTTTSNLLKTIDSDTFAHLTPSKNKVISKFTKTMNTHLFNSMFNNPIYKSTQRKEYLNSHRRKEINNYRENENQNHNIGSAYKFQKKGGPNSFKTPNLQKPINIPTDTNKMQFQNYHEFHPNLYKPDVSPKYANTSDEFYEIENPGQYHLFKPGRTVLKYNLPHSNPIVSINPSTEGFFDHSHRKPNNKHITLLNGNSKDHLKSKTYSNLDLDHLLSFVEIGTELNRHIERSNKKAREKRPKAGLNPEDILHQKPTLPPFLPTIPSEIYPHEDIPEYGQNNIHRPNSREPQLPPTNNYPGDNAKFVVLSVQADSPNSVKMLFGLPPILVGLKGSVDLRYTDEPEEDESRWHSQVFAPTDGILSTPRLDFRLAGLKPSTTYKIKGKLFVHNLSIDTESKVFTVRTLDALTIEEKTREINSRLSVLDVNDTTAHVTWRHFTENELQFIDGIQVRYRPVGTPIYIMTELLHHSRSNAELHDLRPGSRYEASLVLIPPPRTITELHDPNHVEFTTAPYVDPYNWTVTVETRTVGSEAAELIWRGIPAPAERWVRVYRAAHACGVGRTQEHDAFRLASRDQPNTITLTGLEPNSRCRMWLELFLTNGKVKTSNVLEVNTKSLEAPETVDNVIEASSVMGGRDNNNGRGNYYGALVAVGVVAALGALTSLLLLLVVVRRHRPHSVSITTVPSAPRESSLPPYDNPAYKLELQQETMDL